MVGKTIDQKATLWNNKMAITFVLSLIIGTNAGSVFVQQQKHNTQQIIYNRDANKRRTKNSVQILKFEIEIEVLKKELEYCKNKLK